MTDPEAREALRAGVSLLAYLWEATGKDPSIRVRDLFAEDDPIVADVAKYSALAALPDSGAGRETAEAPSEDEASGGDDLTGRTRYRNASDDTPRHHAVNLVYCGCGTRLIDGRCPDSGAGREGLDVFDRLMNLWQQPWSEPAFGEAQMLLARLRAALGAGSTDEVRRLREALERVTVLHHESLHSRSVGWRDCDWNICTVARAALTDKPSPEEPHG